MIALLLLLAATPLNDQVVRVKGADGGTIITVICSNCSSSGSSWYPDGGPIGSVAVSNFPGTWYPDGGAIGSVTVTGSVATTGPLTDVQLRASPVPVSGTITASGPLTDAQLRALAVPVSGTVTASGPLTNAEARATPLPVGFDGGPVTIIGSLPAGTNNIGDVDVLTLPALPAGNNNVGDVDIATMPNVTVGTFPDNEPFNVAQLNGVTPLMGSGATGTGSLRVTPATDSPTFGTANGTIPTQSALQSGRAVAYGSSPTAVTAGNNAPAISDLEGRPYVNDSHPRSVSCQFAAATTTTLLELTGCAAVASNSYYITDWRTCGGIATAATVPALLRSGTGANCATATTTWDTCWHAAASCCDVHLKTPMKVTAGHAICGIDATVGTKSFTLQGYVAP